MLFFLSFVASFYAMMPGCTEEEYKKLLKDSNPTESKPGQNETISTKKGQSKFQTLANWLYKNHLVHLKTQKFN